MQIEAFEPAGSTGIGCTLTVTASNLASASGNLIDVVTRGTPGAANKVWVVNSTSAIAFVRFTTGASTATTSDLPVLPGAGKVFKINQTAVVASVILAAAPSGATSVFFALGDGL